MGSLKIASTFFSGFNRAGGGGVKGEEVTRLGHAIAGSYSRLPMAEKRLAGVGVVASS